MPVGSDVVPFFETLWYAHATLAPLAPGQEEVLLPLTRYLRARGAVIKAAELFYAQGYLQFVTRRAAAALSAYDAVLTPTLAQPPVPVGYFDQVNPAGTSSGRSVSPRSPRSTTSPASPPSASRCTGAPKDCRSA